MTENPDDHLEAHKTREREKSRLALLEQIRIEDSLKLAESIQRLTLTLLSKN